MYLTELYPWVPWELALRRSPGYKALAVSKIARLLAPLRDARKAVVGELPLSAYTRQPVSNLKHPQTAHNAPWQAPSQKQSQTPAEPLPYPHPPPLKKQEQKK